MVSDEGVWFSFFFRYSLTPIVAFFLHGGVLCLFLCLKLLSRRKFIVIYADFTESCGDVKIGAFGVCCSGAKKLFRWMLWLPLFLFKQSIMSLVLVLFVGST